ncbi:MAG: hypothetical protein P4M11_08115 [Candidatus Pacebacteria bacterium]|nr:hypothetical protein [Candidatus Paceibacterota bacterium]
MPGFFRRFFLLDYGPPPPPDAGHVPSFTDQRIVETIYSASKERRAVITIDATGDYRIHSGQWDTSDWEAGHGPFWDDYNTGCHTDNLARARELAHEEIKDLQREA